MRIIHLTDFHLNNETLNDWNDYIKESLINKLSDINKVKKIDLIAFTGDLLDKGGKDFESITEAFGVFKKAIIEPILAALELPICNFLIIPGNHDLDLTKDSKISEIGSKEFFKDRNNISSFMRTATENNDFENFKRIQDYKEFEKELYKNTIDSQISLFSSSFKLKVEGKIIGVCCFNSAWRCYDDKDFGNILIGEDQLSAAYKYVSKCDLKIALVHHPLDWLAPVERGTISKHIFKEFDLLLVGHVHESMTAMQSAFNNCLFTHISPSGLNDIRSDSRTFSNGFSVIDYDAKGKKIMVEYLRYNHDQKSFVLNTDAGEEGKFIGIIPGNVLHDDNLIEKVLNHIRAEQFPLMDEHMIGAKAGKVKLILEEAFVLPPINKGETVNQEKVKNFTISEIVKIPVNQIFFGNQESGKTTLLFRLIKEFVNEHQFLNRIPVYINFEDIGNKDYVTAIREYLLCTTEEVKELLNKQLILLFIDNLNYRQEVENSINKFQKFYKDYPGLQIIAAAASDIAGIVPADFIQYSKISFENYFIKSLKSKEIKSLMKLWIPEDTNINFDEKIERLVSSFNSYSLPSSAMSVSLFIWSLENTQKKPINNAVLLEMIVEIILEKLKEDNIYRENFDFTNKVQLLARIANEMLDAQEKLESKHQHQSYSMLYSEFLKVIEKYILDEVGFTFSATSIANFFIERKIFIRHQSNSIKFSYSCFFHFFLAKRMEFNEKFKEYVTSQDNYYKFVKEIDLYTGLKRSDHSLLQILFERFEFAFANTDQVLNLVNVDKHFTPLPVDNKPRDPEKIELNKIIDSRPTEEQIEQFQDNRLAQIESPSLILTKKGNLTLETLLIIMSNVLRNSEGVEDIELKKKVYNSLVKHSVIWSILYREFIVDFIIKNKKLPSMIPFGVNLQDFLKNIPYFVHGGMCVHSATNKLSSVIQQKILLDHSKEGISDIESFFSVALYLEVNGHDFDKYFKQFIRKSKNNITRDYSRFKLQDFYYRRTKKDTKEEKIILDILLELQEKEAGINKKIADELTDKLRITKDAIKE